MCRRITYWMKCDDIALRCCNVVHCTPGPFLPILERSNVPTCTWGLFWYSGIALAGCLRDTICQWFIWISWILQLYWVEDQRWTTKSRVSCTACYYVVVQTRPISAGNMSSVSGAPGGGYHHGHHHHHHHQTDDGQSSRSGDTPGPHSHSNLNSYANCDHNSDGGTPVLCLVRCSVSIHHPPHQTDRSTTSWLSFALRSTYAVAVRCSGGALVSIGEVTLRRARLVLGWATVSGRNQPSRSTQPGHPFVGRRNEYQRKLGVYIAVGTVSHWPWINDSVVSMLPDQRPILKEMSLYAPWHTLPYGWALVLWFTGCAIRSVISSPAFCTSHICQLWDKLA